MYFQIRQAQHLWFWVLLNEAEETVAESHRTFPSAAQASAAALAFAHLVSRAGKSLKVRPSSGTLL
jgi:hypothetical protein